MATEADAKMAQEEWEEGGHTKRDRRSSVRCLGQPAAAAGIGCRSRRPVYAGWGEVRNQQKPFVRDDRRPLMQGESNDGENSTEGEPHPKSRVEYAPTLERARWGARKSNSE